MPLGPSHVQPTPPRGRFPPAGCRGARPRPLAGSLPRMRRLPPMARGDDVCGRTRHSARLAGGGGAEGTGGAGSGWAGPGRSPAPSLFPGSRDRLSAHLPWGGDGAWRAGSGLCLRLPVCEMGSGSRFPWQRGRGLLLPWLAGFEFPTRRSGGQSGFICCLWEERSRGIGEWSRWAGR